MSTIRTLLIRWKRDERGVIAVMFALCLLVVLGLVGLAVDYGLAVTARNRIQSATDAATLQALESVRQQMSQGVSFQSAQAQAIADAQNTYLAQLGSMPLGSPGRAPNVQITLNAQGDPQATVIADGTSSALILKVLNIDNIKLRATSQASTPTPYVHLTFLVDTSQSMSIPSNPADITTLANDPNVACAFACHDSATKDKSHATWRTNGTVSGNNWLYLRCYGAGGIAQPMNMRLDDIRAAMNVVINQLGTNNSHYTASFLTFGSPPYPTVLNGSTTAATETCPSGNGPSKQISYFQYGASAPTFGDINSMQLGMPLSNAASIIPLIDVEDNTYVATTFTNLPNRENNPVNLGVGFTQTTQVINWVQQNLRGGGDGTQANPYQAVLLFTDGTESDPTRWAAGSRQDTLPSLTSCQNLKSNNITLMIVDTTYPKLSNNSAYQHDVQPIETQLSPNLMSCATPGFYQTASASSTQAIQSAASALVGRLLNTLTFGLQ